MIASRLSPHPSRSLTLAVSLFAALALLAMSASPAQAAPGDLDPTFGGDGTVTSDFPQHGWGTAIAMQGCCRIVAVGYDGTVASGVRDIAVQRYLLNGALDPSFGTGGEVFTDLGGDDFARDVVIQRDRKIIAAGDGGPNQDVALVRYNTDGSLDASFGTGGSVLTDFGGNDVARGVAVQTDSKIVIAGFTLQPSADFILARYNADGSLDPSFGTGGKVITDFGGSDLGRGVAIQANGKIVAVGYSNYNFALARYNTDGSLDPSFGTGGKVITDFGENDVCRAVALQKDGKIICGGYTGTGLGGLDEASDQEAGDDVGDFAMARYNTDGSLDSSFGTGGMVVTNYTGSMTDGEHARTVILQRDGKIILAGNVAGSAALRAGQAPAGKAPPGDFGTVRYNADGSVDTTFGVEGWAVTDFGGDDGARDAALQSDGKVVEIGITGGFGGYQFALARYVTT